MDNEFIYNAAQFRVSSTYVSLILRIGFYQFQVLIWAGSVQIVVFLSEMKYISFVFHF